MDRPGLAEFLRRRREALQPSDVGLPAGPRRRTAGLRREEVAALAVMSTDYLSRMEQQRGPQPSEPMVAALARALRLTLDERDHLFRLAGHNAPSRVRRSEHVSPGLMRLLDRLQDTPAMVASDLSETLVQNAAAVALLGDHSRYAGWSRSAYHRWFTLPSERLLYPPSDHDRQGRLWTAELRAAVTAGGADGRGAELVADLYRRSAEFAEMWDRHEVLVKDTTAKTIVHPELGEIELDCQVLSTHNRAQVLLVFTAGPGTSSHDKLALLSVVGHQRV